jgi:hypothetical protein
MSSCALAKPRAGAVDLSGMNVFRKKLVQLRWALTPASAKQKQLEEIKDYLRQWPETAALLDLAAEKNIPIDFDASLIGHTTTGVFVRSTAEGKTRIRLQPLRPPEQVAPTLIHELRHMWQMDVLGIGANDFRGEYSRPQTKLMTTRIKEADAYAFTHMIVTRMNRMAEHLEEAVIMAKNLADLNPTKSLTQKDIEKINAHFHEKTKDDAQKDLDNIRARFLAELEDLDGYDRSGLRKYHALYTTPRLAPKKKTAEDSDKYVLKNLRKILRAGIADDAPDYMADITDFALARKVIAPIQADVIQTMRLMTAFERATAKGKLTEAQNRAARETIDTHIRAVMGAKQKKKLEKPQF